MRTRRWTRTPRAGSQAALLSTSACLHFGPFWFLATTSVLRRSHGERTSELFHTLQVSFQECSQNSPSTFFYVMSGHHSNSPSWRVKCWPQQNGRFYGRWPQVCMTRLTLHVALLILPISEYSHLRSNRSWRRNNFYPFHTFSVSILNNLPDFPFFLFPEYSALTPSVHIRVGTLQMQNGPFRAVQR
jgi:hypothetical protein